MLRAILWIATGPLIIALGYAVYCFEKTRPKNVPRTSLDIAMTVWFVAVIIMVTVLVVREFG